MVVVAIIGILAAVAIPAFMKNARKAKTTEAVVNLKKLQDGAISYYHEEKNKAGSVVPIPKQFPDTPATSDTQPAATCCTSSPTTQKCTPDPTLWTDSSWQALKFSMDDPHYYQYRYVSARLGGAAVNGSSGVGAPDLGNGGTAATYFYADALGDLNCDNVLSTFEMLGGVGIDGSITTGGGLYKNNELE